MATKPSRAHDLQARVRLGMAADEVAPLKKAPDPAYPAPILYDDLTL